MSKRGENIHKRKDGRWEGRYVKGRNVNGSIIYGYIYGKTYRDVKDKLIFSCSEIKSDTFTNYQEHYFEHILNLWLENNRIRQKAATVSKYQYLIETHIAPSLGKVKLSEITSTMINSFLLQKLQNGRLDEQGGLSPSYVRNIMLVINGALKFAVDEQLCPPLKSPIFKPTVQKRELSIFSCSDQQKLESYLLSVSDPTCIGILLSLYTGLRVGEVCALSWDDIDFERHIIHIRHTVARIKSNGNTSDKSSQLILDTPKTKSSSRDIPISSALFPLLQQASQTAVSKYVVSQSNDFVSPRTFEYRYHRILKKCEIENLNYHALRHTFATRCVEAGIDVKSLSEILGHSNVSVTLNTYVHSSIELKRSQLEKLAPFPA